MAPSYSLLPVQLSSAQLNWTRQNAEKSGRACWTGLDWTAILGQLTKLVYLDLDLAAQSKHTKRAEIQPNQKSVGLEPARRWMDRSILK